MPGLLIVLGIVLVGLIAYASWLNKKKRQEGMQALAARLGLQFAIEDPFAIDATMPHALFQLGDGRGCENVMWGTWDSLPVTAFDYWYYDESTDSDGDRSRTYHRFNCVMTQIQAACLPMSLTREGLFSRIADSVGFKDIQFESEEFNRTWNIKCSDAKFATDFVDQRMMVWLMNAGPEWSFETAGGIVLVYHRKMDTTHLMSLLACCKSFVAQIPRVVYSLYPAANG